MKMEDYTTEQEAKFNAGISIALDIFNIFKQAEYFSSMGDYRMWHTKLEANERKMWPKLKKKQEALDELKSIKQKGMPSFRLYIKRSDRHKQISGRLFDDVKLYLTEYEKSLTYWRDVFGYGMPLKEDMSKAAWR